MIDEETQWLWCPECSSRMVLRHHHRTGKPFWGCSNYPECCGFLGAHPDGTPLGTPANAETREMRICLHQLFATRWQYKDKHQRKQMYAWLRDHTRCTHIAKMNAEEIVAVEHAFLNEFENEDQMKRKNARKQKSLR